MDSSALQDYGVTWEIYKMSKKDGEPTGFWRSKDCLITSFSELPEKDMVFNIYFFSENRKKVIIVSEFTLYTCK